MKISWFIPHFKRPWQKQYNYDKVMASVWIRSLQLIPYLEKLGIKSEINTWSKETNVAVFLRQWDKKMQKTALKLKKNGARIIVDTPVNYFSSQDLKPFKGEAKQNFESFINIADAVFCPSPYTAKFGEKVGYKTYYIPDSIDFRHFSLRKKQLLKTKPTLIWSGVSIKSDVLNFLTPAIKKHNWRVIIISDIAPVLDFSYSYAKWSYKTFPEILLEGDIGIFPRKIDNEYDKGHSFFKIGVFLTQHIPVICSPVPSYNEILTKSNSICINTLDLDKWEQGIIEMGQKLHKLNFNAQLVEKYSTQKVATMYKHIFERMVL